jgi:hypothetical protein
MNIDGAAAPAIARKALVAMAECDVWSTVIGIDRERDRRSSMKSLRMKMVL